MVVDDVLIGRLRGHPLGFDVSDTRSSPTVDREVGGCIEATPAVWNGRIYVGTHGGSFYALHGA